MAILIMPVQVDQLEVICVDKKAQCWPHLISSILPGTLWLACIILTGGISNLLTPLKTI